jgi:hypothetical protein
VPLGILLAVRLVPPALMAAFRAEAGRRATRPTSRAGLVLAIVIWIATAAALIWACWRTGGA